MKSEKLRNGVFYVILTSVTLFQVVPIAWIVFSSLLPADSIMLAPAEKLRSALTLDNYASFIGSERFRTALGNSLLVSFASVVLGVAAGVPLGYQLARKKFRFNKDISFWTLTLIMMPPVVMIIPMYSVFTSLGIVGTSLSLIVANALFAIPFVTWLAQSFVAEMSPALEEAAMVDGASPFGILLRVIIPSILPGLATIGFFVFMFTWNDYLLPSILTKFSSQTLQVFIGGQVTDTNVAWDMLLTGSVVSLLPLVVVSFFLQKYLSRGFSLGAFK